MKTLLQTLALILLNIAATSQDTVKVMVYNLLYYNYNNSYCNESNNNITLKNQYLRTIVSYVSPDIFGVNEVSGAGPASSQMILDSILNTGGITWYSKASYVNSNNSTLISTIYYDSRKFTLVSQNYLPTNHRDIILYKFYYNSPDVVNLNDTVYLTCIVQHLKAGSTQADQDDRAFETQTLMDYLNSMGNIGNCIVMGDFNVQTSAETSFQNLVNHSNYNIRFYDPVSKLGDWNNNTFYAQYHTQSTFLNTNGCAAGGGLDDRFDFILASFYVMNNIAKVAYVQGSYKTIGQDGYHFNLGLNSPPNNSAPAAVINALANMSDHLPITINIKISQTPVFNIEEKNLREFYIQSVYNTGDATGVNFYMLNPGEVNIRIFNLTGECIYYGRIKAQGGFNTVTLYTRDQGNGLYILNVTTAGASESAKFPVTDNR